MQTTLSAAVGVRFTLSLLFEAELDSEARVVTNNLARDK